MLDITYAQLIENSRTRALVVKEKEFDEVLKELKSFLPIQPMSWNASLDDASGTISLNVLMPVTYISAAQLNWDFTEILMEKSLEQSPLVVHLLGSQ